MWHWRARVLYSASVLDLETVACFLANHETNFSQRNIAKPRVYLLSSRQHIQSASEKALSKMQEEL
jgi:hypothetical protein